MNCPRCGTGDLWRESADVGIGVIYGPYGCPCGWSEDPVYDMSSGRQNAETGSRFDQYGWLHPVGCYCGCAGGTA